MILAVGGPKALVGGPRGQGEPVEVVQDFFHQLYHGTLAKGVHARELGRLQAP